MIIFLQEILMLLFLWLLKLIDGIMEIFSAIAGIGTVSFQGKQVNILDALISNSSVGTIFWCVFILAVGLTCIFAIVGLVKNMIANNRQVSGIMGKFFLALLGTLAMLAVVFLGILISNAVLKLVAEIFQLNGNTKLSSALFNACVGSWKKGRSIAEFNTDVSVGKILGSYKTVLGIWPSSWKGNGMVDPNSFMYLPALIGSIGLLIALIIACINLSKRIYEIVLLYIVMPVSMSTLPLDDGARFKIWRETFVTKIILAYGTVFSVNLFILLLPLITQMKITGASNLANSLFYIVMLVGGAVVIPAGQQLFAKLFGSAEDSGTGSSLFRSAMYGGRMIGTATIGLGAKAIKGGAHGIKKIAGGHSHKKDGGEKFTDDNKGGGGDDGDNDSEKHTDNQSSSTDNENQTTGTNTSSSNDSESDKAESEEIMQSRIENGNNKPSSASTDTKSSTDNADTKASSENERLENQTTGTSAEGNNDMAGMFESGNGKSSMNSSDNKAAQNSTKTESDKAEEAEIMASRAESGIGKTSTSNADSNPSSTSADNADSEKHTDSQTSTENTGGQAVSTDSNNSATSTNTQPSSSSSDGKTATTTENQASMTSIDGKVATADTASIVGTSGNAESGKYTESQAITTNNDSKLTSSQTTTSSDSKTVAASTDSKVSSVSTDSKTATQSTDSKTDSANSGKYTESQASTVNTDNKTVVSSTDSKTAITTDNDKKPNTQTAKANSNPSMASTDSKATDSGKYSDTQSTADNSDNDDIGGTFE